MTFGTTYCSGTFCCSTKDQGVGLETVEAPTSFPPTRSPSKQKQEGLCTSGVFGQWASIPSDFGKASDLARRPSFGPHFNGTYELDTTIRGHRAWVILA